MPLEFDNNNQHCTALVNGVQYSSVVSEVVITTNDTSHMSEALIDGQAAHRTNVTTPWRRTIRGLLR
jgi:hypothetical protein